MTEEEARTKWCPFARTQYVGPEEDGERERIGPPANRMLTDDFGVGVSAALCIGSVCMAWRWDEPWTGSTEEGHGGDLVIRLKRKPGQPRLGYCGLAGAPR